MGENKIKKILIISASIGTGHMQAAKAIEEYLTTTDLSAQIKHVDFLSEETLSLDTLIKETYIKILDIFPMFYDLLYRLSQRGHQGEILQTVVSWMMKSRMLKLLRKEKPDLLVFTHPFPCGAASILKRQRLIDIPIIGVITDFTIHQFWVYPQVDRYCVGTDILIDKLTKVGIEKDKIIATGMPIRRAYFDRPVRQYVKGEPLHALVMGGGLGLGSITKVIKALEGTPGIGSITVATGKNEALHDRIYEMKDTMGVPITLYGYTTEIPRLMREASLLFTKPGGLTCREALAVGIPMIFFSAIPGQEEENADLFQTLNCARWVKNLSDLPSVVEHLWNHPEELQSMSDASVCWQQDGAAHIGRVIRTMLAETEEEKGTDQVRCTEHLL